MVNKHEACACLSCPVVHTIQRILDVFSFTKKGIKLVRQYDIFISDKAYHGVRDLVYSMELDTFDLPLNYVFLIKHMILSS
jgi:hypothetical protein